jgi:hypothetical protein
MHPETFPVILPPVAVVAPLPPPVTGALFPQAVARNTTIRVSHPPRLNCTVLFDHCRVVLFDLVPLSVPVEKDMLKFSQHILHGLALTSTSRCSSSLSSPILRCLSFLFSFSDVCFTSFCLSACSVEEACSQSPFFVWSINCARSRCISSKALIRPFSRGDTGSLFRAILILIAVPTFLPTFA